MPEGNPCGGPSIGVELSRSLECSASGNDDRVFPTAQIVSFRMKPDFSGEWILDRAASSLSAGASAIEKGVKRIEHREPRCQFEIRFIADGEPIEYSYSGVTDGKEVAGERSVTSLYWDGNALVFTERSGSAGGPWMISFRYELLEGGRKLRAVEQIQGGGRDQENIWMFERAGDSASSSQ